MDSNERGMTEEGVDHKTEQESVLPEPEDFRDVKFLDSFFSDEESRMNAIGDHFLKGVDVGLHDEEEQ